MPTSAYLVTAAVMAGLLAVVVVAMRSSVSWRRVTVQGEGTAIQVARDQSGGPPVATVDDSSLWMVGFLLLVVATIGATVFAFTSGGITVLLAFIGLVVVGFLGAGVYAMAKSHGHPHSHAVGETIVALGAVWLVAVVAWLILTDGSLV